MRFLFCTALLLLLTDNLNAQRRRPIYGNNTRSINLRIGPEIGFAAGDFDNTHNFGTGLSAVLDIPLNHKISAVAQAGYISFSGDRIGDASGIKYRRSSIIPLRAGIHYRLTPSLYTGVQLGQSSVRYLGDRNSGFSHGLGVGYFRNRLDLGARWDHHYIQGGLSSFNIKAAYVLRLSRRYRW